MVVDDDRDSCEALAGFLDQSGYLVEMVRDASLALARLDRRAADLVLTDLQMPGMDGLELIHRAHERRPKMPMILVTAAETRDLCTGAKEYGAVACLTKPVNPEELLWAIERALACGRRDGHGAGAEAPTARS
jgi:DNA-binding NtrC family response regulator